MRHRWGTRGALCLLLTCSSAAEEEDDDDDCRCLIRALTSTDGVAVLTTVDTLLASWAAESAASSRRSG